MVDGYVRTDSATFFRVSRQAYVDHDVWKEELSLIFDRSWLYVGHESEVPAAGDFQTRDVGGRPVIFVRGNDGGPRVFLNACAHRGAKVCSSASGSTKRFSCPYHGWAYGVDGNLVGLPGQSAYGAEGWPSEFRLQEVSSSSYRGFVFINFNPQECLDDYLGEAKYYIDLICDQSESSLKVIPGALRHALNANWKLLAENGVDAYHLPYTHGRFLDFINVLSTESVSHKRSGVGFSLGRGHSVIKSGPPSTGRPVAYWSALFPESMKPVIDARYRALVERVGKARADDMALTNRSLFIFPNLVINDILGLNIRTFFPVAPGKVDVSVWGAGFSGESESELQARIDGLISFVGPGGLGTPDDVEIIESCQKSYSHFAYGESDFSRGMVPNTQHHTDEEQNRGFWMEWAEKMKGE